MADLEAVEQVDYEVDEIAPGSEPDDSRRKMDDASNVLFVSRLLILISPDIISHLNLFLKIRW